MLLLLFLCVLSTRWVVDAQSETSTTDLVPELDLALDPPDETMDGSKNNGTQSVIIDPGNQFKSFYFLRKISGSVRVYDFWTPLPPSNRFCTFIFLLLQG